MKQHITLDEVVDYLNELIEIDRPAMAALIANRVPCSQKMADHPTVQVAAQHGGYHVGLVGVVNGMFGIFEDGFGPIVWVFDEEGTLLRVAKKDYVDVYVGRFEDDLGLAGSGHGD